MMLEGANMQAATVQAMAEGSKAMKAQMNAVNLDVVEDTMDDIRDQMDEMQEIGDVMSQDLTGGMFDDSELEAEFADLEEELLDEQLLDISVGAIFVPLARVPIVAMPTAAKSGLEAERQCCYSLVCSAMHLPNALLRALLQAPVGVAGPAVGAPDAVAVEPEPAPAAASTEDDELAALEAQMAQ